MPSLALAADMILTNGKVFTANTAAPSAEAVAIRDGNILAVGKLADVEKAASADAEKIDLGGGMLLPGLIERKGAIINLSSVAATYPYPGGNVYAATKAFVRQFSLDLRADLHGTGVRVTSIEPGMVETEFTLVRTGSQDVSDKLYAGVNPMTGEDIADTILWVATLPPHLNINSLELMPVATAETRAPRSNETYDAYARYVERRDAKTRGARRLLLARGEAAEEAEA